YDPISRRIVDYVDGRKDIEHKTLRAIGNPKERFAEDHLRLLRAIRFAARLGFRIEPATWSSLKQHAASLPKVSAERIREEIERMLVHPTRAAAWNLIGESGLLPYLWEGSARVIPRNEEIAAVLAALPRRVSFELILAILALPDADEAARICDALRTSN